MLTANKTLTSLDLGESRIWSAVPAICEAVQKNKHITRLDVSHSYRDFTTYRDFTKAEDVWPISNLITQTTTLKFFNYSCSRKNPKILAALEKNGSIIEEGCQNPFIHRNNKIHKHVKSVCILFLRHKHMITAISKDVLKIVLRMVWESRTNVEVWKNIANTPNIKQYCLFF